MTLNNNPDNLPNKPGVYLFKDIEDKILYVGKAKSLKKRVKSYFKDELDSPKTRTLMKQYHSMEYIVTDTEKEALILESNLIKKHLPRYNIRLKDDKRYPYVKITKEAFPRVLITRRVNDDGSYYYGPFTDVIALRRMLKFMKSTFRIRDCKNMDGPCLNSQMELCEAPCDKRISKKEYLKLIEKVNLFFEGKYKEVMAILEDNMEEAALNHEYEKAAIIRDQITSVKAIVERQKMEFNRSLEQDVIACSLDEDYAAVVIFRVRSGKIIGKEEFLMSGVDGSSGDPSSVLSAFLKQYYSGPQQVPPELILQFHVEDESLITDWLQEKSSADVEIKVPTEGMEYRLVKMVAKNADIARNQQEQVKGALLEVKDYLGIPRLPRHIEAFDISNISGKLAVGSMVVFEDGSPKKSSYRRFKIETAGPDDYAMMREVLTRRYSKLAEKGETKRPDLILIDGGKGQLNTALNAFKSLKLTSIPVIGLAKEFEHIFIPEFPTPIILPENSKALHLLMRVRDEAHRFAVTYHKKLRTKAMEGSALDNIPGVGPKRKLKLIRHFGSLENIKKASVEEIALVDGFNQKLARVIHQKLLNSK